MDYDIKDKLIGKIFFDYFKITEKIRENWIIKIYKCVHIITNEEFIIKLVRSKYLI